jgi:rfaE bifunctional protein kinase chain/domain
MGTGLFKAPGPRVSDQYRERTVKVVDKVFRLSDLDRECSLDQFKGATICFGHFNTIHPGHVRYFRTAREHSETLIVALEGDAQLPPNQRQNIFPEEDRAQSLAALDLIDYIVILDSGPLEDFLRSTPFSTLVLGKEFEDIRAPKVALAVAVVNSKSASVIYDAGETHYASSELFSGAAGDLETHRWQAFNQALKAQAISLPEIFSKLSHSGRPHILVIGDTIVDRYVACDPIGMSNEAPLVVVKEMETHDYVGGAGIVAAHIAALGAQSTFLSVTGNDDIASFIAGSMTDMDVESVLLVDASRPTTLKIRYLVENQKLFRVSRLKEHSLSREREDRLIAEIKAREKIIDSILISDFVYGVITPRILDTVRAVAAKQNIQVFGDLQCSSQVGNILKFEDFSLICPTEREARIALGNHSDGVEFVANLLIQATGSANMVLKLGGDGFIAYEGLNQRDDCLSRQHFPALSANPVDVTGAGDALLAAMASCMTCGLSLMQASAFASCVSAIAVQTVGNRPIDIRQVYRFYSHHLDNGLIDAV